MAGLVLACPGHLDAEGTAFQQNTLGIARALLIEITGTGPVMTSVGASISSEHALAKRLIELRFSFGQRATSNFCATCLRPADFFVEPTPGPPVEIGPGADK
jgi:hypothetical protein